MIATSSSSGPSNPLEDPLVKKVMREKDMKIASLEMTLAATKSSLSDSLLRIRQAEEMVGLLSTGWDMKMVADIIGKHFDQRSTERAVQQQALIQATLVSLNTAMAADDPNLRSTVNTVVKGLTAALGTMHEIQTQQRNQSNKQNLTRSANGTPSRN